MPNTLSKCLWLVNTIYEAKKISFKELNLKWKRNISLSDGNALSRTSFNRWKDLALDMFGIVVECDKGNSFKYYILNPEELENGKMQGWLLDNYALGVLMTENM